MLMILKKNNKSTQIKTSLKVRIIPKITVKILIKKRSKPKTPTIRNNQKSKLYYDQNYIMLFHIKTIQMLKIIIFFLFR